MVFAWLGLVVSGNTFLRLLGNISHLPRPLERAPHPTDPLAELRGNALACGALGCTTLAPEEVSRLWPSIQLHCLAPLAIPSGRARQAGEGLTSWVPSGRS